MWRIIFHTPSAHIPNVKLHTSIIYKRSTKKQLSISILHIIVGLGLLVINILTKIYYHQIT